ncbi:hypothetical protein BMS3Bbin15_01872 [archaeon BMS3Bbin15]|nr:hypothetical protein BMS3Bbin15_01872 [archaeon BMS3Bbin15]
MIKELVSSEEGQVSLEFILLVGGVIVAALTIIALEKSLKYLGDITSSWVGQERNISIQKITR